MALEKVTYVDGVTIIGAKNLNDIQDELIRQGEQQTEDEESTEAALALKADKETTYTKTEVDSALALKADKSDTYTKAQVDASLALKADKADTYTKAQVDASLELKADKTETYTKGQVDSMIQEAVEEAVKESEYSNFEMKSVSGDFIHITDGAGLIPVKDLKIGIDAVQDLHGYDTPWVGGAGKNKFDGSAVATTTSANWGVTFSDDTLVIQHKNEYTTGMPSIQLSLVAGTYVASFESVTENGAISLYIDDVYNKVLNNGASFSVEDGHVYELHFSASANSTNSIVKFQIESGSTPSTYAPYANICPISGWTGANIYVSPTADEEDATVYSVTWEDEAGTVYGGTLDVTTGELVVTHKMISLDGTSSTGVTVSDTSTAGIKRLVITSSLIPDAKSPSSSSIIANILCNQYDTLSADSVYLKHIGIGLSRTGDLTAFNPNLQTLEAWLTEMQNNSLDVIYELASPIPFTIDPTEVLTLLGENNIFADTGAIEELIYRISRQ